MWNVRFAIVSGLTESANNVYLLFYANSHIIRHTYSHVWCLEIYFIERKQLSQTTFAWFCRSPTRNFQNAGLDAKTVYHRSSFVFCVWARLGVEAGDLKISGPWTAKSSKSCLQKVFSLDEIYFQTSTMAIGIPYDVGIRAEQKINIIRRLF